MSLTRKIRAPVIERQFRLLSEVKLTKLLKAIIGTVKNNPRFVIIIRLLTAINPSTRLPDQESNPDRAMCLDIDFIKYWFSGGCGFRGRIYECWWRNVARSYRTVPQTSCIMYSSPWSCLWLLIGVLSLLDRCRGRNDFVRKYLLEIFTRRSVILDTSYPSARCVPRLL